MAQLNRNVFLCGMSVYRTCTFVLPLNNVTLFYIMDDLKQTCIYFFCIFSIPRRKSCLNRPLYISVGIDEIHIFQISYFHDDCFLYL